MTTTAFAITFAQTRYLGDLLDQATTLLRQREEITGCEWPEAHAHVARVRAGLDTMTKVEASRTITEAKDNNDALRKELAGLGVQEDPRISAPEYVSEVGIYRVGDRIFKVLPSRNSDRHYAKELTGFHWEDRLPVADVEGADMKFRYAKGAMRLIRAEHRVSLDMEKAFGQLTGACIDCGKLLTDPKSIDYGKGPVCSDNYTH